MAEDLDGRIGAVLDKLTELGIADNTYVVLVSDNGYRHEQLQLNPSLTQPRHGGKWWLWQGGIRVPMIVRGPGMKPGAVFEGNVILYDLLPTFVEWAGGDPTKLKDIDGVSLAPYMAGKQPDDAFLNRPLYFHCPHYRSSMPHSAIFKCTNDPPTGDGVPFVTYDGLPSDHYLKLAGEAGRLLRGELQTE